jgi:Protein of unknown function (DUF3307)
MDQFLAHLVGDYVLQSHVMAIKKTSSWKWALIHVFFYGLPFLFLVTAPWQWWVIVLTHAVIDRYKLADKWCRWYGNGHPGLWWTKEDQRAHAEKAAETIYNGWRDNPRWKPWVPGGNSDAQEKARYDARLDTFPTPPPFLGVWLTIIVDNTFHLLINHFTLR